MRIYSWQWMVFSCFQCFIWCDRVANCLTVTSPADCRDDSSHIGPLWSSYPSRLGDTIQGPPLWPYQGLHSQKGKGGAVTRRSWRVCKRWELVKGSSTPARKRLQILTTFQPECSGLLQGERNTPFHSNFQCTCENRLHVWNPDDILKQSTLVDVFTTSTTKLSIIILLWQKVKTQPTKFKSSQIRVPYVYTYHFHPSNANRLQKQCNYGDSGFRDIKRIPEFDTYRYVTHLVYTHTSIVLENFSNFLREKM